MDTIARQLDAARHQFKTTYSSGNGSPTSYILVGLSPSGHRRLFATISNEITGNLWGILKTLNLFGDAELVDALNAQQGLFSVVETSASAINSRSSCVTGALHTRSGIQAAIELIEPQVKLFR